MDHTSDVNFLFLLAHTPAQLCTTQLPCSSKKKKQIFMIPMNHTITKRYAAARFQYGETLNRVQGDISYFDNSHKPLILS